MKRKTTITKSGDKKSLFPLKPVRLSTSHRKEGKYNASIIIEENGRETCYDCYHEQSWKLWDLRDLLIRTGRLPLLIQVATNIFINEGNEGIFYFIIEDDIANIELNGKDFWDEQLYREIVSRNKRFLLWLEEYIKQNCPVLFLKKNKKQAGTITCEGQTFAELFERTSHYNEIKNVLADEGFINRETGSWIDGKKAQKELLVAIIKDLHAKKYFKKGIKLTAALIKNVIENDFRLSIGISTINHTKATDHNTDFLPYPKPLP